MDGPQRELVGCGQSSTTLLQIPGNKLEIDSLLAKTIKKLDWSQEIGITNMNNDI